MLSVQTRFGQQEESSVLSEIRRMLLTGLQSSRKVLVLKDAEVDFDEDKLSLEELIKILTTSVARQRATEDAESIHLPKVITFPYSRHSSYAELRDLVKVFKPMDVYPCTVNKETWNEGKRVLPKPSVLVRLYVVWTLYTHEISRLSLEVVGKSEPHKYIQKTRLMSRVACISFFQRLQIMKSILSYC
jgi:hypothetical protein